MSLLDRIRKSSQSFFLTPDMKVKVKGFEVSITRKEVSPLSSLKEQDSAYSSRIHISANPTHDKPTSKNHDYEIAVRPTGANPEYPTQDKPSIFIYKHLPHGNNSCGSTDNIAYLPAGCEILKFELSEEFFKAGVCGGRFLPDHHAVWLKVHYRAANDRRSSHAFSSWIRQSEHARVMERQQHSFGTIG